MRLLVLLFVMFAPAALLSQEAYPLGPDSQVRDVPHGVVEKVVLPPGKFFPGTPHNVAIYMPANAPAKPLPYMVFLDGSSYLGNGLRAATVLDNLIAAKVLPPMVGVFIDPGVLPAIRQDAQNRYERVFEYDSLSDRYVNFLLEEVLPMVATRHALSSDPDEHAIGGTSTGAVGAFVAAWHRPDVFHRVLSLIGTYVAMKGADTLPEIVRKTEAKPLRVWMQDGANDHLTATEPYGTFYAGTWPRANQMLFDALQFEGYDAKLTIGTGGHDTKQGGAELPDALRWLWAVDRVVVKPPAALGDAGWMTRGSVWATVDAVGGWEHVTDADGGGGLSELAVAQNGDVLVGNLDAHLSRVNATTVSGVPGLRPFAMAAGDGDELYGVSMDFQGRFGSEANSVLVKQWTSGDPTTGPKRAPLTLSRIHDISGTIWAGSGRLYFIDHGKESRLTVFDVSSNAKPRLVVAPITSASALALSPDKSMLVVTDRRNRHQWSMQLRADGLPVNGEPFYRLEVLDDEGGATSAAFDSLGQVYFATALGVQVCEANGRVAMILNSPVADKPVEQVAFGGAERDWLYVVADGKLFRRKMKVHGVPVDKPEKPPVPPL